MHHNQCSAYITNTVPYTTNVVPIHLMRCTMMCQFYMPIKIFLKIGCITTSTLMFPDVGLLLVSWIILTTLFMRYYGPEMGHFLSTVLTSCSFGGVISHVLLQVVSCVKPLLTQSASIFGQH